MPTGEAKRSDTTIGARDRSPAGGRDDPDEEQQRAEQE